MDLCARSLQCWIFRWITWTWRQAFMLSQKPFIFSLQSGFDTGTFCARTERSIDSQLWYYITKPDNIIFALPNSVLRIRANTDRSRSIDRAKLVHIWLLDPIIIYAFPLAQLVFVSYSSYYSSLLTLTFIMIFFVQIGLNVRSQLFKINIHRITT